MVGKYCGRWSGYLTLVSGDQMLITFNSDDSIEKTGFLIHFTAVPHSKYSILFALLEVP